MNPIVHFEMPVKDPKRAQDFYNKTFGWKVEKWGDQDYWMVRTAESDKQGMPEKPGSINGGFFKPKTQGVTSLTIDVPSVDDYLQKAQHAGATIVTKKEAVGDMGFMAQFKDPEGNLVGLWETAKKAG
jgi:uncharacterized protein